MQDCIDGIISLMFCEVDDATLEYQDLPLFFNFAEPKELIDEKLKAVGLELYDFAEVEKGDESAIDDLIDSMDDLDDDE